MRRKTFWTSIGGFYLCAAAVLDGCSQVALFDPRGPVGQAERSVILVAFGLMLIVVIPVIVMALWFPRRYRASNREAVYMPNWCRSIGIESAMWLVPGLIVAALGTMAWITTYRLDPYKPIRSAAAPLRIEAVALDWKWLFIYPEQGIAAVNQLVFPAGIPLRFRITSDTVLAGFFIPRLGSQIYAMPGAATQLNLMADEPGIYEGHNQQFSGRGYSGMSFKAVAVTAAQFEAWVQQSRQAPDALDRARYEDLEKPGVDCPVMHFSAVESDLFEHIVARHHDTATSPLAPAGDHGGAPAMNGTAAEVR